MWNGVKIKEGRRIFCDALFDILMLLADWESQTSSVGFPQEYRCGASPGWKIQLNIYLPMVGYPYCKKNPAAKAGCRILCFRDQ